MNCYSIHDTVAEMFLPPFFARNDGQASRMMIGSLGDSFTHRADFNLYRLGSFDDDSGQLTSETPSLVLAGLSISEKLDPRVPAPITQETSK